MRVVREGGGRMGGLIAWRVAPFVCGVLLAALAALAGWLSPWTPGDWQFWVILGLTTPVVAAAGATAEMRWRR